MHSSFCFPSKFVDEMGGAGKGQSFGVTSQITTGKLRSNALSGECHIVTISATPCMKYKASALQLAVTFDSYFASPLTRPHVCHPYRGWVRALEVAMAHSCLPSLSGHCDSPLR